MPRLMSVSHTTAQVVDRSKTVTRRNGWSFLKPGERLTLCRKVMGRREGEPLVRLAEVEVVSVRRESLFSVTTPDVIKEGFPDWHRGQFIEFFCRTFKVEPTHVLTRIEWRYLD